MPPHLWRISVVLFGALALYLDSLFGGATDLAANYRNRDGFELSQKLWAHWQARFPALKPGDEYALVDEFAELLGLRGAYEWRLDSNLSQTTTA